MILTSLPTLPKNEEDLGKMVIPKGFELLPKMQ